MRHLTTLLIWLSWFFGLVLLLLAVGVAVMWQRSYRVEEMWVQGAPGRAVYLLHSRGNHKRFG